MKSCPKCGSPLASAMELRQNRCRPCHRERARECDMRRKAKVPWESSFYAARTRCENPSHTSYYRYGGKGVMLLMTKDEVKALWFRDGAANMKRASLDRIDSMGHYTFANCRFIEHSENARDGASKKRPYLRGKINCPMCRRPMQKYHRSCIKRALTRKYDLSDNKREMRQWLEARKATDSVLAAIVDSYPRGTP